MLKLLRSYRFALSLIVLLLVSIVFFAVAMRYHGWSLGILWFPCLSVLLMASIVVCTYERAKREIRRSKNGFAGTTPQGSSFRFETTLQLPAAGERIRRLLQKGGWHVSRRSTAHRIVAERGRLGPWGSILFHVALIVIGFGLALDTVWGYRGMFALTQGETFLTGIGLFKNETRGVWFHPASLPRSAIVLDNFEQHHRIGRATTPASDVSVRIDSAIIQDTIYINNGLTYGGYVLHQGALWGYSIGLIVMDSSGKNIFRGFVRLASHQVNGVMHFQDRVMLGTGAEAGLELFPDYRVKNGNPVSMSSDPNNPLAVISLSGKGLTRDTITLGSGESGPCGKYVVAVPGVRYWTQFEYVRQPGLTYIYAGFAFLVIGLGLRFSTVRRRLSIILSATGEETQVWFAGGSEKSHAAFDGECRTLFEILQTALREKERTQSKIIDQSDPFLMVRKCA